MLEIPTLSGEDIDRQQRDPPLSDQSVNMIVTRSSLPVNGKGSS